VTAGIIERCSEINATFKRNAVLWK